MKEKLKKVFLCFLRLFVELNKFLVLIDNLRVYPFRAVVMFNLSDGFKIREIVKIKSSNNTFYETPFKSIVME